MIHEAWVAYAGLVLARIAAWSMATPWVATRAPRLVRVALALMLALFYLGEQPPPWDERWAVPPTDMTTLVYFLAVLREVVIGAALGVLFGLWLLPARVAGEFLAFQVGLNVSPLPGPAGEEGAGAITSWLEVVAALVFLGLDAHHVLLAVLHASWSLLPLAGANLPPTAPMLRMLATAYDVGLLLAAPLAACLLLLAVTLALLARVAPQLNIYSVGFTLQVLVVLVGGLVLMPELVAGMHLYWQQLGEMVQRLWSGG
jgi:flagellar biosynthetic protein FliR